MAQSPYSVLLRQPKCRRSDFIWHVKDTRLMQLLRELFLCAARFKFIVMAKYVPGKENAIADTLSRFNMQVFRQLAPHSQPIAGAIPLSLLALLSL